MNNWAAPLLVFIAGAIVSFAVGEPGAIFLVAAFAGCGYAINKENNK